MDRFESIMSALESPRRQPARDESWREAGNVPVNNLAVTYYPIIQDAEFLAKVRHRIRPALAGLSPKPARLAIYGASLYALYAASAAAPVLEEMGVELACFLDPAGAFAPGDRLGQVPVRALEAGAWPEDQAALVCSAPIYAAEGRRTLAAAGCPPERILTLFDEDLQGFAEDYALKHADALEPLYRAAYRGIPGEHRHKRILFSCPPYSGTGIYVQILQYVLAGIYGFSCADLFDNPEIQDKAEDTYTLSRLTPGSFAREHFRFQPGVAEALADEGFKVVLMKRDPRDAIISLARYEYDYPGRYWQRMFSSREELLDSMLAPLARFYKGFYEPWLDNVPDLHMVSFEGTKANGFLEVKGLFEHFAMPVSNATIYNALYISDFEVITGRRMGQEVLGGYFRKGVYGEWRKIYTPAQKAVLKAEIGDLLVRLGYEKDLDW